MASIMSEDEVIMLEKAIVKLLDEERQRLNVSRREWGDQAFMNEIANPQSKIQDLVGRRTPSRKAKRLSVGDLIKLCQVLNLPPEEILSVVLFMHRQGRLAE